MAEVKVLVEGYARKIEGGWAASSTATLARSNGKSIVIDPGCDRKLLLDALKREGLSTEDIDFVILTHGHTDHTLLTGMFENARVLNNYEIYSSGEQVAHHDKVPGTELEILQTPGHCLGHCSAMIPTAEGVYVAAGDVFWWVDGEGQVVDIGCEDQAHPEDGNMEQLVASRKKLLETADFIIPGHGKMFRVK